MIETLKSLVLVYRLLIALCLGVGAAALASRAALDFNRFEDELKAAAGPHEDSYKACEDQVGQTRSALKDQVWRALASRGIRSDLHELRGVNYSGPGTEGVIAPASVADWAKIITGRSALCTLPSFEFPNLEGEIARAGGPGTLTLAELNGVQITLVITSTRPQETLWIRGTRTPRPYLLVSTSSRAELWRSFQASPWIWDQISALTPAAAVPVVRALEERSAKDVSLGGIPIPSWAIAFAGPLAIFLLLFDLMVHAEHLRRLALSAEETARNDLASFPASPLLDGAWASWASWFGLVVLPAATALACFVTSNGWSRNAAGGLGAASGILALQFLIPTLRQVRALARPR